jgi:hypothetical protein
MKQPAFSVEHAFKQNYPSKQSGLVIKYAGGSAILLEIETHE